MSILGGMYSGISGLNANSTAMTVIGNNIANVNTPAFKNTRPEFADILSSSMNSGYSVGRGTEVVGVTTTHAQGGFQTTSNTTDLALEGKGFFMLRDTQGLGQYYTRAGNFHIDDTGFLVTTKGYRVQGFSLDDEGGYSGTSHDIQINTSLLAPQATESVDFNVNLSSKESVIPLPGFDINDPSGTSNFSSSITTYDSLGNSHQVTIYFSLNTMTPAGSTWDWNVAVAGEDWQGGVPGAFYNGANGQLTFDNEGRLDTETTAATSFDFSGGANPGQAISFDFGSSITTDGGTGLDGTTQFGEQNATLFQSQNGYAPSYLESLNVDADGRIFGKYGNGEVRYFAQTAVVNFQNINGLEKIGGNLFSQTLSSGEPIISVANVAGNGRVFSNSLEQSNVDLAEQFVNMIITQRGFQANSRSISTADQMLNELVNIVR